MVMLCGCSFYYYLYFIEDNYLKETYKKETPSFKYELTGKYYHSYSGEGLKNLVFRCTIENKTAGTLFWNIDESRLVSDKYIFKPVESFIHTNKKYYTNKLIPLEIKPYEKKEVSFIFYNDVSVFCSNLPGTDSWAFDYEYTEIMGLKDDYFDSLEQIPNNNKMKWKQGLKFEMGSIGAGRDSFWAESPYCVPAEALSKTYNLKPRTLGVLCCDFLSWTWTFLPTYKQFNLYRLITGFGLLGLGGGTSLLEYNWFIDGKEKKTYFPVYFYAVPLVFSLNDADIPIYLYIGGTKWAYRNRDYLKAAIGTSFPLGGVELGAIRTDESKEWGEYVGLTMSLGLWKKGATFDGIKMPKEKEKK